MGRRQSGGLEAEVLATLWSADEPLTTAQVAEKLSGNLAYNTVQTILTRLRSKGAVDRELLGRAHAYIPKLDAAGLAARRMHAMLGRGGDHVAILRSFVSTLTQSEEATLAALLKQQQDPDQGRA